jgi:drug/metabolite transporter (DMT)-like permease
MKPSIQGSLFALLTCSFWGTLPIALKQASQQLDALTIVWLRFSVAALWLWLWLPRPRMERMALDWSEGRLILLLALASLCLGGNFALYNISLYYLSAPAAQIVSQSGPLLLLAGGILVLREPFYRIQAAGGAILITGMMLFFNDRLHELFDLREGCGAGIALGLLAAFIWAAYGIAQKLLLRELSSAAALRVIYTCIALGLAPAASPLRILDIDVPQALCLAFCCLNTIVAYGSFGKSLSLWHTAGVGAVISLTPLFTVAGSMAAHALLPGVFPAADLNTLSLLGAFVVVSGALLMAAGPHILAKAKAPPQQGG